MTKRRVDIMLAQTPPKIWIKSYDATDVYTTGDTITIVDDASVLAQYSWWEIIGWEWHKS